MVCIRSGEFAIRGILLAIGGDAIRVALEDCGDAAEYRRVDGRWVSEFGEIVEIDLCSFPPGEPDAFDMTAAPVRSQPQYCVV